MSSTSASSSPSIFSSRRVAKIGLGLLALAAAWTVVLGWWLPSWARARVEAAATQALGTPVSLGELTVQPWTLTVGMKDLKVGASQAELLKLPEAQLQLSLESLWRLTPVVRRLSLDKPELWIERQSADRFNFSAMAQRLHSPPPQAAQEPARFAVYNIRVHQGLVRYSDRVLHQEHRVEALNIGVPFVSNLPSFINVDVQPLLEARVDGSTLRASGRTLPFSEGLRSTVDLNWRDIDLPRWLRAAKPFMPPELAIDVAKGRLDTQLVVSFEERRPPAVASLQIKGGLKVSGLDVAWPTGGVQGRWSSLDINGIDASPLLRKVVVGSVALSGLELDAKDKRPAAIKPGASVPVAPPAAYPRADAPKLLAPWAWAVGKVRLAATRIQAEAPGGATLPKLGPVTLSIDGLNANPKITPAVLTLAALDAHGGQIQVTGVVTPTLPLLTLKVLASKVQPTPWLAALGKSLPLPLQVQAGELALSTDLNYSGDSLTLSKGQLQLTGLKTKATRAGLADRVNLVKLDLQGLEAQVSLAPVATGLQSLTLASVTLDQLDAQATRDAQGRWGMQPAPNTATTTPAQGPDAKPATFPALKVGEVRCKACKVQVNDQTVSPAASLSLQQADLGVKNLSTDTAQVVGFDLSALGQGRGRLKLGGEVRPQPLMVRSRWAINALDLRGVQPYLAPYLNMMLAGAKASINGMLDLDATPGTSSGAAARDPKAVNLRYQGRLALTDLRTQDSVNQADFLRWRSLSFDGVDVNWRAGALTADLGRIVLDDFYGRVIINPDGKLNLSGLVKRDAGGEDRSLTTPQVTAQPASPAPSIAAAPPALAASEVTPPSAMAGMNLRWQVIKLAKGRVDFTDNFIKPNYSARLTQVEGDVSAVASSRPEPATVRIAGQVDDSAPLLITGQLHPLGPRLYSDIQGSAKGIELTRLTPYAGRYAGYAIEKGTLSVTVHYKVDQGKLEAQNQIFLDQLTFGDKVDSPDATSLPVQFAVSLLKNNRGEINVSLPVSGSLDDPEFSVGGIVWRVVVNLLTKAVTAPFSLLTGGSGQDELGFVPFEAGDDELNSTARQRLDSLVTKLGDRPQLKLEATGRADPAIDEAGLRERHLLRLMRQAKARATEQPFASTEIAPGERAQWLSAAYKAADIKKPRNLVGLAKALPPAEMEALLKAAAPADKDSLLTLANRRGDRVKAYLVSRLSPERVLLTASKVGQDQKSEDQGSGARVQFTLR